MLQDNIRRALGLDGAYIGNIENGKQNLTISTMEKTAKTSRVNIDTLLR